jgi:hypothetical protein
MAQAISRRSLVAEELVEYQVILCGICGVQIITETIFAPNI